MSDNKLRLAQLYNLLWNIAPDIPDDLRENYIDVLEKIRDLLGKLRK